MEATSIGLAFLAGLVSIFSPCVLPLLPIVLGSAASEHRLGPLALAAGLALSFVGLGLFVATIGFAMGLDGELFRAVAAFLLLIVGLVLIVPALQARVALAAAPLAASVQWGHNGAKNGLTGQFVLGALLGAAWAPCVGPTLGAASMLAAQARDLTQVGLTMFAFATGTALPLLLIGLVSGDALMRWRGRMLATGTWGKKGLGLTLAAIGVLILTGYDKSIESALMQLTPTWLNEVTTRF